MFKARKIIVGVLSLLAVSAASAASAASYEFTWTGANGYKMEGAFSIADDLTEAKFIDESAIECFWVQGYRAEAKVGSWSVGDLTPETTWSFGFKPQDLQFQMSGNRNEWNMNGSGRGCGKDGFGFHAGSYAQDVCINDRLIRASQVTPNTPMQATRNDKIKFKSGDCIHFLSS